MNESSHIVGTIQVVHQEATGVIALVNGRRQLFPDLDAVFRTAIGLLDEQAQPHALPGPLPQQPLAGFTP
jgi:hypothetical protein